MISCPAGHQLYEARWLRQPRIVRDYARYWFRTPGAAQPRNYSTWLADSVWAVHLVQDDPAFAQDLLGDLIKNYEAWEKRQYVPEVGMFWQNGHDDGMEFNINSRQTRIFFAALTAIVPVSTATCGRTRRPSPRSPTWPAIGTRRTSFAPKRTA